MIVYLASPNTQQQAEHACDMPVLFSFAIYTKWMDRYQSTFKRILIDSGAYSTLNSGTEIDVEEYTDWADRWSGHADAVAGLDDIGGDWKRSMQNYEAQPQAFPTIHDTDPPELLEELVSMAQERSGWIGIGLMPPREGKERWIRDTCDLIPEDMHIHGWALRKYTHIRRLSSVDSTNWWRDAMKLRTISDLQHLTYGECLEIVCKRYQRWTRTIADVEPSLFSDDK